MASFNHFSYPGYFDRLKKKKNNVLVCLSRYNKIPEMDGINNRHLFLVVLEAANSKQHGDMGNFGLGFFLRKAVLTNGRIIIMERERGIQSFRD